MNTDKTPWAQANPEKHAALRARQKAARLEMQAEALDAYAKSQYKSPQQALEGYCRNSCLLGKTKRSQPGARVYCDNPKCPLFPYKNGNPYRIKMGKEQNNVRKGR